MSKNKQAAGECDLSAGEQPAEIIGVRISPVTMRIALSRINEWIESHTQVYICVVPGHTIMDCQVDPGLRDIINNAAMQTPDGMSVVWALRNMGFKNVERVYGPDLMYAVFQISQNTEWVHYFYGGEESVLESLQKVLGVEFPAVRIVGSASPPFRELTASEDEAMVMQINALQPDVVWVGLGSPKQERWMAAHLGRIEAPIMIGVGAAFDFISGCKPQAPVWIQKTGLEWLFRLLSEPGRLWRRYVQYPKYVLLLIMDLIKKAKSSTG